MNYFTTIRSIFIISSNKCCEEYDKIDKFVSILNKTNIGVLIEKVSCEIMLMCLGRNIYKFVTLLDNEEIKSSYWEKPYNLKNETFPFPKQKTQKRS